MIHLYCGDGKGKTTAAVGLAVRAAGAGKRVVFAQFFKAGDSSEIGVLRGISGLTVCHCQTVRGFWKNMTQAQKQQATTDYSRFLEDVLTLSQDADMLVLDEIVSACNHGAVDEGRLCAFLQSKLEQMEVVLTGRNPSVRLISLADYITEMKKRKHPFDRGVAARRGIEY